MYILSRLSMYISIDFDLQLEGYHEKTPQNVNE